ncbi:hypothetical protein T484DRAFT_1843229 [Baffinella frigidus]|nr:hypothetical protein T484DRAFT_1843229 [Cryptophyta sp. CCMP2293]
MAGITGDLPLVFGASMTSGLLYSVITMPFETGNWVALPSSLLPRGGWIIPGGGWKVAG